MVNEIQNYNLYYNKKKDMNLIYKEILIQMKTLLLVNKSLRKLKDVAEAILNSNRMIKETIKNNDKMIEIIKKLSIKKNNIFKIVNHSLLGPVIVLINKKNEIPK